MTVTRRLLTVEEFQRAYESGVYAPEERLELLRGEVSIMTPIGRRHVSTVIRLQRLFHHHLDGQALISTQNSLVLSSTDLPQPDLALLRWRDDDYAGREPEASDAFLVIEVADTTLAGDRGVKLPLYAQAGVPEVWIVNLRDDITEIHRNPAGSEYGEVRTEPFGTAFAPQAFPECAETWLDG